MTNENGKQIKMVLIHWAYQTEKLNDQKRNCRQKREE